MRKRASALGAATNGRLKRRKASEAPPPSVGELDHVGHMARQQGEEASWSDIRECREIPCNNEDAAWLDWKRKNQEDLTPEEIITDVIQIEMPDYWYYA